MVVTELDFDIIRRLYTWRDNSLRVGNMYIYERGDFPQWLKDEVMEYFKNKSTLKHTDPELYQKSKNMLNAIAEEVRAQVARYISYGLPLMHCDGHHHVHNRLGLYSTILPILKDAGFRSVRNRYTVFGPLWCGVRGRMGNWRFRRFIKHLGLASTEAFGGWNGETLGKWSRFGSVEIMVHPHYDMNGNLVNVIDSENNTGPEMRLLQVN
jgi:hypothetical protein